MTKSRMKILGAACFLFLMGGALRAQETHVTMKNGAIFSGLIVHETQRYLDLELGDGRIRLAKNKILKRTDERRSEPSAGKNDREKAKDGGETPKPAPETKPKTVLKVPVPPSVRNATVGAKAANSAASLRDAPLPEGTPEHTVASFLRLVGAGHTQIAVDRWVDSEKLLVDFFPAHAKSLTRYSFHMASESWASILRMVFSDPALMAEFRKDGIEVRTVRETGDQALVEVALPRKPDSGEQEIHLLTVEGNRIVDFGYMLRSLRKVCGEMTHEMDQSGSWLLVPLLQQTAERILAARADTPDTPRRIVLPTVKDLRETQIARKEMAGEEYVSSGMDYRIIIPEGWKQASATRLPRFADMMMHNRSKRAFAMVLAEESPMALSALERAARANLSQASEHLEIHTRRLVSTPDGQAVRFNANAVIEGVPLVYQYHLTTSGTHTYQVICWCHEYDQVRFDTILEDIIRSFDILPVKPSKGPTPLDESHSPPSPPRSEGKQDAPKPAESSRLRPDASEKKSVPDGKTAKGRSLKDKLKELLGLGGRKKTGSASKGN